MVPTKPKPSEHTDERPADTWIRGMRVEITNEAAANPEMHKRVLDELERLTAHKVKPERLKLWLKVAEHRDGLSDMIDQWARLGRQDLADECRKRISQLDADLDAREPSLRKLRAIADAWRIATEQKAIQEVLLYLQYRRDDQGDPEKAEQSRQIAERLLGQLRGCPVDLESERTKVLRAIRRGRIDTSKGHGKGNTSKSYKNIADRIVKEDY